jgi:hypothetical protein
VWKVVLLLSLIPLVGAALGRHWFWTRVRLEGLRHDCGTSVRELRERLGLPPGRRGTETHAAALGNALRECGLALLEKEGNTLAKARINGAYLTKALPALVLLIAVFAILSKRVPAGWAVSGAAGTVAFWTLLRLTGMPIELRAVARGTEALKASRALKRVADEEEVIRCANASVWSTVWPF